MTNIRNEAQARPPSPPPPPAHGDQQGLAGAMVGAGPSLETMHTFMYRGWKLESVAAQPANINFKMVLSRPAVAEPEGAAAAPDENIQPLQASVTIDQQQLNLNGESNSQDVTVKLRTPAGHQAQSEQESIVLSNLDSGMTVQKINAQELTLVRGAALLKFVAEDPPVIPPYATLDPQAFAEAQITLYENLNPITEEGNAARASAIADFVNLRTNQPLPFPAINEQMVLGDWHLTAINAEPVPEESKLNYTWQLDDNGKLTISRDVAGASVLQGESTLAGAELRVSEYTANMDFAETYLSDDAYVDYVQFLTQSDPDSGATMDCHWALASYSAEHLLFINPEGKSMLLTKGRLDDKGDDKGKSKSKPKKEKSDSTKGLGRMLKKLTFKK